MEVQTIRQESCADLPEFTLLESPFKSNHLLKLKSINQSGLITNSNASGSVQHTPDLNVHQRFLSHFLHIDSACYYMNRFYKPKLRNANNKTAHSFLQLLVLLLFYCRQSDPKIFPVISGQLNFI